MSDSQLHLPDHLRVAALITLAFLLSIYQFGGRLLLNLGNIQLDRPGKISIVKDLPKSNYLNGVYLYEQNRFEEAVKSLSKVQGDHTGLAHWFIIKAIGHTIHWEESLREINLENPTERALYTMILFQNRNHASSQELTIFEGVISQYPDMIIEYANYFLSTNQYEEAGRWARLVPDFQSSFDAQVILGRSFLYSGNLKEADSIFQSLYLRIGNSETAFWYGKTLFNMGKTDQGTLLLEEAVKKSRINDSRLYMQDLADAYLQTHRCSQAKDTIVEIGKFDPVSAINFQERMGVSCP